MAIGIDDLDFEQDDDYTTLQNNPDPEPEPIDDVIDDSTSQQEPEESTLDDRGVLAEFLQANGIEDLSKIMFEDEDGQEEEVAWDTLNDEAKLSILTQLSSKPENDLDDSELQLINTIRGSKMSPSEYIDFITQRGIQQYVQNSQQETPDYQIDQYNDDELFIADLISRMGRENITDDEVKNALEKAKENQELFTKQMTAIRNEYKQAEDENRQYEQYLAEQERQEQFNQYAAQVQNSINNLTEFGNFDLNMDQDDKEELYEFITGFDEAGNSILGKALNDPDILTKTAWFILYGDQMLDDVSEYVKQQVTSARKKGYAAGVEDAKAGKVKDVNKVVYKPKSKQNDGQLSIDDLD